MAKPGGPLPLGHGHGPIKPAAFVHASDLAPNPPNFGSVRRAILNGLVSAQGEATGWNALRDLIPDSSVVRTSDTVVTITLPALAGYDITASETLTDTIPAVAVAAKTAIVATPTIGITAAPVVATGASTGASTVTAVGQAADLSIGTSTGASTVTAVGAAAALATGASSGAATVTAVGAASDVSMGASSGTATVVGIGADNALGVGVSVGDSTATAVGQGTASTAVSLGAASVTAVGQALVEATGTSTGAASVLAQGQTSNPVASADGLATVLGVSAVEAVGVGVAQGDAAVNAFSPPAVAIGGGGYLRRPGYRWDWWSGWNKIPEKPVEQKIAVGVGLSRGFASISSHSAVHRVIVGTGVVAGQATVTGEGAREAVNPFARAEQEEAFWMGLDLPSAA
jgi:hypothetical protein